MNGTTQKRGMMDTNEFYEVQTKKQKNEICFSAHIGGKNRADFTVVIRHAHNTNSDLGRLF